MQARYTIFLNHRFVGMGNHLGSLSEASGGPEGQEPPVWAVEYHFHGSSVRGGSFFQMLKITRFAF